MALWKRASALAPANKWMHNPLMALEFTTSYVKDAVDVLRYYKRLGERAIEQVPDAALTIHSILNPIPSR